MTKTLVAALLALTAATATLGVASTASAQPFRHHWRHGHSWRRHYWHHRHWHRHWR